MDSDRFDALSRSLATGGTRRGLMRLLGALPLVGVLTTVLEEEADARRHRKPKGRQNDKSNRHRTDQPRGVHEEKKKKQKKKKRKPASPPLGCTPTTCAAQGKNCGMILDGCGNQIRCGPDSCGEGYTCTDNRCLCANGNAVCQGVCCEAGQVCQKGNGACCTAQGKDAACAGRACGPATDSCTGEEYACGTPCPVCFTCVDGTCEDTGGVVCGEDCCTGTGQTCGGGGTPGVCGCTKTTYFALRDEICPPDSDCEVYGICGTFSDDGCGNSLDCGTCARGHPCFACENNRCLYKGGAVCGTACCGSLECCVNPGTSLCGYEKCLGGRCCPVGFLCCNARDGSFKSTCFGTTECGGAVVCCHQGHTCCTDEPCCTSDAQCTGGRRCISNGAPSRAGCCSFNF